VEDNVFYLPDNPDEESYQIIRDHPEDWYGYEVHDGTTRRRLFTLVGTDDQLLALGKRLVYHFEEEA
jgi:hypothetical protein